VNPLFLRLTVQFRIEILALNLVLLLLLGLIAVVLYPQVVANRLHAPRDFYEWLACANDELTVLDFARHLRLHEIVAVVNHRQLIAEVAVDALEVVRQLHGCIALRVRDHVSTVGVVWL